MLKRFSFLVGVFLSLSASSDAGGPAALEFHTDFSNGESGWTQIFTDLPVSEDRRDGFYELDWGIRPLPPELGVEGTGYMLQGNNHSDDLGMYIYQKLGPDDGVVPFQRYRAEISIEVASNAPTGCFGAGGAPGESVTVQLGATPLPPVRTIDEELHYRLTNRETRFESGNVANGIPCSNQEERPYRMLRRSNVLTVTADAAGELWILIGTESGFEGLTRLYYKSVRVALYALK